MSVYEVNHPLSSETGDEVPQKCTASQFPGLHIRIFRMVCCSVTKCCSLATIKTGKYCQVSINIVKCKSEEAIMEFITYSMLSRYEFVVYNLGKYLIIFGFHGCLKFYQEIVSVHFTVITLNGQCGKTCDTSFKFRTIHARTPLELHVRKHKSVHFFRIKQAINLNSQSAGNCNSLRSDLWQRSANVMDRLVFGFANLYSW